MHHERHNSDSLTRSTAGGQAGRLLCVLRAELPLSNVWAAPEQTFKAFGIEDWHGLTLDLDEVSPSDSSRKRGRERQAAVEAVDANDAVA